MKGLPIALYTTQTFLAASNTQNAVSTMKGLMNYLKGYHPMSIHYHLIRIGLESTAVHLLDCTLSYLAEASICPCCTYLDLGPTSSAKPSSCSLDTLHCESG